MNLAFEPRDQLPPLAWITVVEQHKATATVFHGPWVETFRAGYVEGVWDGPFGELGLDRSASVFGSGAVVRGDSITFVSSTSTTDYLFWSEAPGTGLVKVSNSLPLLLAAIDDELDARFDGYAVINESIMWGINRQLRQLPTKKGSVNRLIFWNLSVSAGAVCEVAKPPSPRFADFGEYFSHVSQCYARLASNARDAQRTRRMSIFSTQSRGYDTTAINSMAKDHGIEKVFTVTKGKAKGYYANEDRALEVDDDGTEICRFFGLPCIQIDRRAVETDPKLEYLFYASIHDNGDFNLQQIGAYVETPTVLLTGCLGEMWYVTSYYDVRPGLINDELKRVDLGNHGLTEVRLAAGYVQLALPYIGARSREDVFQITESKEMEPWRLGTAYDRPIPRRIAEQAGLPRNMFGQVKMASVVEFAPPRVPLGQELRQKFHSFLLTNGLLMRWQVWLLPVVRRWNTLVSTTSPSRHAWNYYLQRVISKLIGKEFAFPIVWKRLEGSIFCFAVNLRAVECRAMLSDRSTGTRRHGQNTPGNPAGIANRPPQHRDIESGPGSVNSRPA